MTNPDTPQSQSVAVPRVVIDDIRLQSPFPLAAVVMGPAAVGCAVMAAGWLAAEPDGLPAVLFGVASLAIAIMFFGGAFSTLRTKTLRIERGSLLVTTTLLGVVLPEAEIPIGDIVSVSLDERFVGKRSRSYVLVVATKLKRMSLTHSASHLQGTLMANDIIERIEKARGTINEAHHG
jgi:hypothetical protein